MVKIVTHNAKFHADDVFGVATLFQLLGKENCEVVRTRDAAIIASGDYVLDVGDVSDPEKNRFDHHQLGGAGKRDNGIEYASFGLVWKKFGEKISGSKEVAERMDSALVQIIDAGDNGQDIIKPLIQGVVPSTLNGIIDLYRPTWKEEERWDERFLEAVEWARKMIEREIKMTSDVLEGAEIVEHEYEKTKDRRIIAIDAKYDLGREIVMNTLVHHAEPIYAILYRKDTETWQVLAIRKDNDSFESRKALPQAWRAKVGGGLEAASGVSGALFCHRGGFMCLAKSYEAALSLAERALNA